MWVSLYLVIAVICVVILIIIAALGGFGEMDIGGHDIDVGHFDMGHGDFSGAGISPLSIPVILIFGACFGSFGAIFEALIPSPYIVPILSILTSIGVTGLVYLFMQRVFVQSQATTAVSLSDLVGMEGLVTIRILPDTEGQVVVNTKERGRVPFPASAAESISTGSTVRIVGVIGQGLMVKEMTKEEGA